jgi:hypothetical protein
MSKAPNDFETRQEQVRREIATPPFPDDVTHYDDGSWECSSASFDLMAKSFKRFGFELDYQWSFATLYARFTFIVRSASLLPGLQSGRAEEKHSPELVAYLRAVSARNDRLIQETLPSALAQDDQRCGATPPASRVEAEGAPTLAPPNRPHLYLVQP